MSNGYPKKVILFPAGGSGNFLANFLLVDSTWVPSPNFRIDYQQPTSSSIVVGSGGQGYSNNRLTDFTSVATLENIKNLIEQDDRQIIISHYSNISELRDYQSTVWLRKIYPKTNVFGWIKNMHFKKQQLEMTDYTQTSLSQRVDQCSLFIADWYNLRKTDVDLPDDLVIDFGKLYNITYLSELFAQANGVNPPKEKLEWAQQYIEQQFDPIEDTVELELEQIIKNINPKDFYDLSAVLFIYEKNHNTIDTNRKWSIDNLPNNLESAKQFLLENQQNYSIF